jgi:S-DNA-T family DNA segregation ATPase FtsK/SpoIIIE
MLFLKPGTSELVRSQGAYLDDDEIGVVKFLKDVAQPQYHPELMQLIRWIWAPDRRMKCLTRPYEWCWRANAAAVSLLQRRLSIGYARASRIIEMMAAQGFW